jgi:hypothetical protein
VIYGKQKSLEDRVVELLLREPLSIKKLYERLAPDTRHLSLRGVYKAVDQLIAAGVLLKVRKQVRVDGEWLDSLRGKLVTPLPKLGVGEKVSYSFTSLGHLDAFWKTIVLGLEALEQDGQVFFYNPHDFWALMPERRESEDAYYRHFAERKVHAFFTIGGGAPADQVFKREYQNEYLQIDLRSMPGLGRRTHLTILGEYLISVRVPKKLAERIDGLYASGLSPEELVSEIVRSGEKPAPMRLLLERNPAKARKLKRSLSLNFYFKRTDRE